MPFFQDYANNLARLLTPPEELARQREMQEFRLRQWAQDQHAIMQARFPGALAAPDEPKPAGVLAPPPIVSKTPAIADADRRHQYLVDQAMRHAEAKTLLREEARRAAESSMIYGPKPGSPAAVDDVYARDAANAVAYGPKPSGVLAKSEIEMPPMRMNKLDRFAKR